VIPLKALLLDYGFNDITSKYETDGKLFEKGNYFAELDEENKRIEISREKNYETETYEFNYGVIPHKI
jgi:hypothetical protein